VVIGPDTFRRLVRAKALLASEAHDALTVRAVAEEVGLSPFHFIRQFRAVYGTTPLKVRTRARLARAKALLVAGAPVTAVCMEVGFSSLGSFSALFAREIGASPTAYRRSAPERREAEPVVAGCLGLLGGASTSRNSGEATRG
jgi:AraC-like DNA-binding protein